jgi:hypothetical protein
VSPRGRLPDTRAAVGCEGAIGRMVRYREAVLVIAPRPRSAGPLHRVLIHQRASLSQLEASLSGWTGRCLWAGLLRARPASK